MFEQLKQIDTELFLSLNGSYSAVSDLVFWWLSNKFIWIPLYLWVIWMIIKKYGKTSIPIIIVLILCIVLSDQISGIIKDSVQRFRPTHNLEISSLVHIVNDYKGGLYGFVSSHAANAFAFAIFTIAILKNRQYSMFILIWALLVTYSRIALGVHYPSDLVCGAAVGICIALILFFVLNAFLKKSIRK